MLTLGNRASYLRGGRMTCAVMLSLVLLGIMCALLHAAPAERPNVIVIFSDDLGYGDLGCYGADDIPTPTLDRMRRQGVKFTDFYVTGSSCMPSRAGLMTGSYPQRVDLPSNVHPHQDWGLNPSETTIAEVFKSAGYATGCFGKWHLGHHEKFLPPNHGFDRSLIIPYSHDMYRGAPWGGDFTEQFPHDYVPVLRGTKTVDKLRGLDDFSRMTRMFNGAAIQFVRDHADERFFLYLPHPMPHLQIKPPEKWRGVSERGPYGDVVAELDHAVGRLLDVLKEEGIDKRTLVMFSSDNGPAHIYQEPKFEGGSNGPLSGRKGASRREGGFRVPAIFRWPGYIPAGSTCRSMATTMDLLPTFAKLIGAELPENKIDGHDIRSLLQHPGRADSPYKHFFYYRGRSLNAVRSGPWKLWLGNNGDPRLFHLRKDPAEKNNVAREYPDVVRRLKKYAESPATIQDSEVRERGTSGQ